MDDSKKPLTEKERRHLMEGTWDVHPLDVIDTKEILRYLSITRFPQGMIVCGIRKQNKSEHIGFSTYIKVEKDSADSILEEVKLQVDNHKNKPID